MEAATRTTITIQANVKAPVEKVWEIWNAPEHITKWCTATPEWHTPTSKNDLRVGGSFTSRMEAKDGSMGFDFGGTYDDVKTNQLIRYTMGDGRRVEIKFNANGIETGIVQSFEAEDMNPVEMQRTGWQAILNNFKQYVETV